MIWHYSSLNLEHNKHLYLSYLVYKGIIENFQLPEHVLREVFAGENCQINHIQL
jgi:hypothetical protein